nr:MAG TPA: hypothetical protein [Caudoviricetes sp.]
MTKSTLTLALFIAFNLSELSICQPKECHHFFNR